MTTVSKIANKIKDFATPELTARTLHLKQIGCLPIACNATKAPCLPQGHPYLYQRPTEIEIDSWFGPKADLAGNLRAPKRGIGLVCGAVSNNVEGIDFDDTQIIRQYLDAVREITPGLLEKLVWVITPRGGLHLIYRCAVIGRNRALARHKVGNDVKARIETRADGGYLIAVGSPASVHKSGKPYRFYPGKRTYSEIETITEEERKILFEVAESFDLIPPAPEITYRPRARTPGSNLLSGDDFNLRGNLSDLLTRHGWTKKTDCRGRGEYWIRPGKEARDGHSATLFTNREIPIFVCHTTSSALDKYDGTGRGVYQPFALFALLECAGDFRKAAWELSKLGFGGKGKGHNEQR